MDYQKPGCGTKLLAFLMRLLPKIGPFRVLSLRMPTPETEQMFEASFNAALQDYQALLRNLREGKLDLPNINLDTGGHTVPGGYFMADGAYARLLVQLASNGFDHVSPELRAHILAHFSSATFRGRIRPDKLDQTKVDLSRISQELEKLRTPP